MSHSYVYVPSGMNFIDCYSQQEADEVVEQYKAEGFEAVAVYWGSCHWEVRYWNKDTVTNNIEGKVA